MPDVKANMCWIHCSHLLVCSSGSAGPGQATDARALGQLRLDPWHREAAAQLQEYERSACACRYDQELQAVQAQAQAHMQELQGQLRMERQRREAAEAQTEQLRQSTGPAAARSPAGSHPQAGSPQTAGRQVAGSAGSRMLGERAGRHAAGCFCASSSVPAMFLISKLPAVSGWSHLEL